MNRAISQDETASASYRLTSDAAIVEAASWQAALYARLSRPETEAGCLLLAPTGAGKTEAIVISALGVHRGGAPRRLFLVGPDGATLDDYVYRLVPYLKASVSADETPRTLYLDTPEAEDSGTMCRRFFPDGSEGPHLISGPLEADMDLILTTFSRFRALFFGSGGVHALASNFPPEDGGPARRDLFFFDEAHGYAPDAFGRFHKLVEFLYAQDLDVVVGSCTLPAACQEELSFLETIVGDTPAPPRVFAYHPASDPLPVIESEIRRAYFQNSRVFGVCEQISDAQTLYERLAPSYPHSVYLYHSALPAADRLRLYAQLRELEKEGEGYLLLTTGDVLETADLDATVLLTTLCPPENLIRRAGRCNRRGDLPDGQVVVIGDAFGSAVRRFPDADFRAALRKHSGMAFDVETWKTLIECEAA